MQKPGVSSNSSLWVQGPKPWTCCAAISRELDLNWGSQVMNHRTDRMVAPRQKSSLLHQDGGHKDISKQTYVYMRYNRSEQWFHKLKETFFFPYKAVMWPYTNSSILEFKIVLNILNGHKLRTKFMNFGFCQLFAIMLHLSFLVI